MNRFEFYKNLDEFKGTRSKTFLQHYGILGQKWGTRRWQNPDGTFNTEGKIRYFGSSNNKSEKKLTKEEKKANKINAKIEKAVQSRLKHPFLYNTKGVNEDDLRKFFTAYYNTPLLKRDANGIQKTYEKMYNSEVNQKMINNVKNAEDLQRQMQIHNMMHQQAVQNHMQMVNQINLQNHLNQVNLAMHHPGFMGQPGKNENKDQKELNKEVKELTNNVETSFNIPDKFKDYKKEIADQVSEQIAYMVQSNPNGELPKKIDINVSDDGYLKIDFTYDDPEDVEITGMFDSKAEKEAIKEAKKINNELEDAFKDYKNRDKIADKYINSKEYSKLFEELRTSNNEKLADDYNKVEEIFKDYKGNDRGTTSRAIAGIVNFLEDGDRTMHDLGFETWFHAYEDGDQGYANGPALYARYEKNIKPEEIDRLYTNLHANEKLMNDNIMYLKNNNQVLSKVDDKYLKRLVERNEDQWNDRRKTSAYWELYDAADDSSGYTDLTKKNYQEAKQIAKKLEKSIPNGGWYYLNQAIDNLNMGDMNYKDLSQADWDRINAEINKLKK